MIAHEQGHFLNDVVNIGGQNEIQILQLAQKIIALANSNSKIVHDAPLKEGDMSRRMPDLTKILSVKTNFMSLEDGIRRLINHYKNEDR
jgi:UDP-glucose 4-epimerase